MNEYPAPEMAKITPLEVERASKFINSKLTTKRVVSCNGVPVDSVGNPLAAVDENGFCIVPDDDNRPIAPPLTPEDLIQETVYYEDLINRFCIDKNVLKPVVCYCTTLEECSILEHCVAFNNVHPLGKV